MVASRPEATRSWNASLQAVVPALYAWGVTVAPLVTGPGSPLVARWAAVLAAVVVVMGAAIEPWTGRRLSRSASFGGFVTLCAIAWAAAAMTHAARLDRWRALAGVLGWALVGLSSAAPPSGREPSLRAESATASAFPASYAPVWLGAALAAGMQIIGWRVAVTERALLVRFVAVAAGLAVVGASADLAVASASMARPGRAAAALRSAVLPLILALVLASVGGYLLTTRGDAFGRPSSGGAAGP